MPDFPVNPKKLALVNVDLQNVFVENTPLASPDGLAVVERVNQLSAACRKAGILVVHTAHVTRPDGSNAGVMGEIFPPVREGVIAAGSFPASLHKNLVIEKGDILLDKPRFGAFHATDLELILRERGVDSIIVTGIATDVCVDTTVREANVRDFRVFLTSDGTGTADRNGVSRQEIQKATLASLGFSFAQVVSVDEMIRKIEAAKG